MAARRSRGGNAFRYYKYVGDKYVDAENSLVTGDKYNIREYAAACGVNHKTLQTRIIRYNYIEIDDSCLSKDFSKPVENVFDCISSKMMGHWLKKPLTAVDPTYSNWR